MLDARGLLIRFTIIHWPTAPDGGSCGGAAGLPGAGRLLPAHLGRQAVPASLASIMAFTLMLFPRTF
ncbi:hypothetical protein [Paracoccus sp. MKU1]|uniref:hypothetical protein n=1 Tax=Paracoccus sp. MKU1 TaxID=1745182 RepID=UPI0007192562|nr:hypothetical protein [Paracoccus sp. MKU1]KRW96843.1 hypothetical protein AQY21_06920 [Paracoccus sp. MKU1]